MKKNINDFSKNEIKNLSDDELSEMMSIESKRENQKIIDFWEKEYCIMSFDARAKYWSGTLFRSMRSQEESNSNPYSIYSKSWLVEILKIEPDFIKMLPMIYNTWGGMFDSTKVDRIIQRLLKQINP